MISLTIDPNRLRRIVASGDAALGAVASASQRATDARSAFREANAELSRWRGHEGEKQHSAALAAVGAVEAALNKATAEHTRVAADSRPAGQLARRCTDHAASLGMKI